MAGVSVRPLSANSDRTHRSKTVLIRSPRRRWRAPQVRRLLTLEDPIDVASRAPELVDGISSIGDQAAARHEVDVGIDRRQPMAARERDDQVTLADSRRASRHDQAAIRRARKFRDGAFDLTGIAHVDRAPLSPKEWSHGLDGAELSAPRSYAGIAKNRRARRVGCDLPEQFRPLPAHAVLERGETGRVASGPCQARDKAGADWVDDRAEHDR